MKNIGICVRHDCNNYGSMLQIFAMQKVIEKIGCKYELIRYNKKSFSSIIKYLPSIFNYMFMVDSFRLMTNRYVERKYPDIKEKIDLRRKLFSEYRCKYIGPFSPVCNGFNELKKAASNYDAIMVGSDQLWNPAGLASDYYNLLFVPDDVRKISFATSFGVSKIPNEQLDKTKKYLRRIEFLSVREESGKEIVKELTGRDAKIIMDPTLMFDKDRWNSFFPQKEIIDKPYLFAYLLGTGQEQREKIIEVGKKYNLTIVTCPDLDHVDEKNFGFGDIRLYNVDPVDFLNLIRYASFICTDSFHGTVFSILNHKKFATFYRFSSEAKNSTNTRIDSLLNIVGLNKRKYVNYNDDLHKILNAEINYNYVDSALSQWREQSYDFLKQSVE